jgi:hypothetical protein
MDLDLDFGHGFIPGVGDNNYNAVDNCVGPAQLFWPDPLDLPWAIVDAAWAVSRSALLDTLRLHGTKVLFDTHGWRYRYGAAWHIGRLRTAPWAPGGPVDLSDDDAVGHLVRTSLDVQAELGADAYLVPGRQPDGKDEDLGHAYDAVAQSALACDHIPPRPLVLHVLRPVRPSVPGPVDACRPSRFATPSPMPPRASVVATAAVTAP